MNTNLSASDISAATSLLYLEGQTMSGELSSLREKLQEVISDLPYTEELAVQEALDQLFIIFNAVRSLKERVAAYEERVQRLQTHTALVGERREVNGNQFLADCAASARNTTSSLLKLCGDLREDLKILPDSRQRFLGDALTGINAGWESVWSTIAPLREGAKSLCSANFEVQRVEEAQLLTHRLQQVKSQLDSQINGFVNQHKVFLRMLEKLSLMAEKGNNPPSSDFNLGRAALSQKIASQVSEVEQYSDEVQTRIVDLKLKWKLFDSQF